MSLENEVVEETDDVVGDDAAQDTEVQDAPEPSLDELLNEFDEQHKPQKKEPAKKEDPDADVKAYVRAQMQQDVESSVKKDVESSVKLAKEAGELNLPDSLIDSYLRQTIQNDERLLNLWHARGKNRASFDAVIKNLGRQLAKSLEKPVDKSVSDSVSALESAVKSSSKSTKGEDKVDFLNMTPDKLREWEDKNLS